MYYMEETQSAEKDKKTPQSRINTEKNGKNHLRKNETKILSKNCVYVLFLGLYFYVFIVL